MKTCTCCSRCEWHCHCGQRCIDQGASFGGESEGQCVGCTQEIESRIYGSQVHRVFKAP